jgi:hypothetical protein
MTPESFAQSPAGQDLKARYGWDLETWRTIEQWLRDMETALLGERNEHRRARIVGICQADLAQCFRARWEAFRAEQRGSDNIPADRAAEANKDPTERQWFTDLLHGAYRLRDSREPAPARVERAS